MTTATAPVQAVSPTTVTALASLRSQAWAAEDRALCLYLRGQVEAIRGTITDNPAAIRAINAAMIYLARAGGPVELDRGCRLAGDALTAAIAALEASNV